MPVLKNARHERMAQALAKGKTADAEQAIIAGLCIILIVSVLALAGCQSYQPMGEEIWRAL